MRKYAPLLTLVSVVLLGVGLVVANMISTPTRTAPAAAPAARAAAAPPAAAAPSAAAAGPGPASAPAPAAAPAVTQKAYTGRTAGNEATVAVAVNDGKATAYVCDGKNIEAWLSGSLDGDRLSLAGRTGSLTATLTDRATLGTVVVDGVAWPFSAAGVAQPSGVTTGRASLSEVAARVGWTVEGTR
ncbi:MAG TPA: hypothetical protein VF667_07955 [Pseudonocardia sp.]